jgi:hypothetical protein
MHSPAAAGGCMTPHLIICRVCAIAVVSVLCAIRLTTVISWTSAAVARCAYLAGARIAFFPRSSTRACAARVQRMVSVGVVRAADHIPEKHIVAFVELALQIVSVL